MLPQKDGDKIAVLRQTEWKLRVSEDWGWCLASSVRMKDLVLICFSIKGNHTTSQIWPDIAEKIYRLGKWEKRFFGSHLHFASKQMYMQVCFVFFPQWMFPQLLSSQRMAFNSIFKKNPPFLNSNPLFKFCWAGRHTAAFSGSQDQLIAAGYSTSRATESKYWRVPIQNFTWSD